MRLDLKTITPVHIGTGEKYGGAEIYKADRGFVRTSVSGIARNLEGKVYEDFLAGLEEPGFRLDEFLSRHPGVKPKERYILKSPLNAISDEVRECIKTGFDIPYIPGSSLKGAIRTALIWKACKDDPMFPPDSWGRQRPNKKWIGAEYFSRILNLHPRKNDPKYDLLRFLEVSDFMPVTPHIHLLEVKTWSLKNRSMEQKPFSIYCETLWSKCEGTITLSPDIAHALNHRDYTLLQKKLPLLGITESDLAGIDDPIKHEKAEQKVISHLKKIMKEFIGAALEHDLALCSENKGEKLQKEIQRMQGEHQKKDLIRLGFSIGTTYQTVMDLIEKRNPELAADLITDMRLGKYRRNSEYDAVSPPYPKSIEFITHKMEMPGWVEW